MYVTRELLMVMMLAIAGTQLTSQCPSQSASIMVTVRGEPTYINVTYMEYHGGPERVGITHSVTEIFQRNASTRNMIVDLIEEQNAAEFHQYGANNAVFKHYIVDWKSTQSEDRGMSSFLDEFVKWVKLIDIHPNVQTLNSMIFEQCRDVTLIQPYTIWGITKTR